MSNPYNVLASPAPEEEPASPSPRPVKLTFAQKMMQKMGHVEGQGLGAKSQGRTEPVEATTTIERRGLGTGTLTADEYLESQTTPGESIKAKITPPTVDVGVPSRFVRIQRLRENTAASVVATLFRDGLHEKVK